jgi:serine/threonine protein kinase
MNFVPQTATTSVGASGNNNDTTNNDDNSFSSGMSSSDSSSDDDSMNVDDTNNNNPVSSDDDVNDPNEIKNAYWIQRTIREAIYGRVFFAVVLKRRPKSLSSIDGADWEVTTDHCAVKEMSWQHIRRERDRLAEDPIKEVSAMQYIKSWYDQQKLQQQQAAAVAATAAAAVAAGGQLSIQQQQHEQLLIQIQNSNDADVTRSFIAMRETNIMMPLDLLSDERNLYSIMPYCDGGELFERLDLNERFSEEEARYWMEQVLNVS